MLWCDFSSNPITDEKLQAMLGRQEVISTKHVKGANGETYINVRKRYDNDATFSKPDQLPFFELEPEVLTVRQNQTQNQKPAQDPRNWQNQFASITEAVF